MSTTGSPALKKTRKYTFAVVAENTDDDGEPQYSELAILSQEMDWVDAS